VSWRQPQNEDEPQDKDKHCTAGVLPSDGVTQHWELSDGIPELPWELIETAAITRGAEA